MYICKECNKKFSSDSGFEEHPCVVDAMSMSNEDLLDSLYKSGGCSKEYYISELKKNVEEAEAQLLVDLKAAHYGDGSDVDLCEVSKDRYEMLLEKLEKCT